MPQCLASVIVRARNAVTDSHLVESFARSADPEAFAELVRRHGPMVLGVCRKVTRHAHDAEDAAQAAFLVLARRAGTIDPNGLASWLFGVAVNTAREARRRTGRRRETLSAHLPESTRFDPEPDFDTRAAIAEELAQLPDRYRELVVRCDLEGESQAAVARRVGLPVGTVYSRLSTARTILAGRLTRRGIAAGVAVLAAPRVGAAFVVSGRPSSRVTELTEAVMRTGIGLKGKWLAVVLLTAGVAASGKSERAEAPMPRPKVESRLAVQFAGHVRFLSPGGKEVARVSGDDAKAGGADITTRAVSLGLSSKTLFTLNVSEAFPVHGRLAPDGRLPLRANNGFCLLAADGTTEAVKTADGKPVYSQRNMPRIDVWSADGRRAVVYRTSGGFFSELKTAHAIVDLATGTETPLPLPARHLAIDWSPDGSWFLTRRQDEKQGSAVDIVLCKVSADGTSVTELSGPGGKAFNAAFSPDGRTVAFLKYIYTPAAKGAAESTAHSGLELVSVDLTTGARRVLVSEPGGTRADGKFYHAMAGEVMWSPDGTRIAFTHEHSARTPDWAIHNEWRLTTIAADGSDPRIIFQLPRGDAGKWEYHALIGWR